MEIRSKNLSKCTVTRPVCHVKCGAYGFVMSNFASFWLCRAYSIAISWRDSECFW